jgi:hypothetical protein
MRKLCVLALLCLSANAYATFPSAGTLKDLTGTAVTSGVSVRFYLRGMWREQPVRQLARPDSAERLQPSGTRIHAGQYGAISGTLYSTSEVNCGWNIQRHLVRDGRIFNGVAGPESAVSASQNINVNAPTLLSSNPVADIGTSVLQGYVFTQASGSTTWTINHNLNAAVSVEFFDSSGAPFCSGQTR